MLFAPLLVHVGGKALKIMSYINPGCNCRRGALHLYVGHRVMGHSVIVVHARAPNLRRIGFKLGQYLQIVRLSRARGSEVVINGFICKITPE
jgi:hypothetical protein